MLTPKHRVPAMNENPRIGRTFGRLTVVERVEPARGNDSNHTYRCVCSCGNEKVTKWDNLRRGHTKSCGCLQAEWVQKYDEMRKVRAAANAAKPPLDLIDGVAPSTHPLYETYKQMIKRCTWASAHNYRHYGGRGIAVCAKWCPTGKATTEGFKAFYADMGPKPGPEYTLDRIDVDGPYSPENCRWADPVVQMSNTRVGVPARSLTLRGKTRLLSAWCAQVGTKPDTVARLVNKYEISLEEAFILAYFNKKSWAAGDFKAFPKNRERAKAIVLSGKLPFG